MMLCVSAVFAYSLVSQRQPATPESTEDDFIQEARARASERPEWEGEGALAAAEDSASSEKPVIELAPEKELDLGMISNSTPGTGTITILNKGAGLLLINRVNSSCGCTKGSIEEKYKKIPPGGSGVIDVTVYPKNVHAFESRKTLSIFSNDPTRPRVDVDVVATVDPEFSVEPRKLDFGQVQKGQPVAFDIVVRQLNDEPFAVTGVKGLGRGDDSLLLSYEERDESQWTTPGRAEFDVHVALTEEAPPGPLKGRFQIQTSCKRVPTFPIEFEGEVVSFFKLDPQGPLVVPTVNVGGSELEPSVLKVIGDSPIEVSDISCSSVDFTATSRPGDEPNTVLIEVVANAGAKLSPQAESVRFAVKSETQTVRTAVPVRLTLGARGPNRRPFLEQKQTAESAEPAEAPQDAAADTAKE